MRRQSCTIGPHFRWVTFRSRWQRGHKWPKNELRTGKPETSLGLCMCVCMCVCTRACFVERRLFISGKDKEQVKRNSGRLLEAQNVGKCHTRSAGEKGRFRVKFKWDRQEADVSMKTGHEVTALGAGVGAGLFSVVNHRTAAREMEVQCLVLL